MNGETAQVVRAIRESAIGRWLVFVDGENFTMSLQRLANSSLVEGSEYVKDVFAWVPGQLGHSPLPAYAPLIPWPSRAVRSYYYTSCTGDDDYLETIRQTVWKKGFTPAVFKKPRGGKSKGVDITLARDLLCHSFDNHLDIAILVAGDADYVPLVEEVKRQGKHLMVAFFGSSPSLSPGLKLAADSFADIEESVTGLWRAFVTEQQKVPADRP